MRIVTWNVNGIRALRRNYPHLQSHDSLEILLDDLFKQPDIVCLQEVKSTQKATVAEDANLPHMDAFYVFPQTDEGRSGVAVFTREDSARPCGAEDEEQCLRPYWVEETGGVPCRWAREGRVLVMDYHYFILLNVYFPASAGPERLPYRHAFYRAVKEMVHGMISSGRRVILVGDINVAHRSIDHVDPERACREQGLAHFEEHPFRRWFSQLLQGPRNGTGLVDVYRHLHPEEQGAFTCWSYLGGARTSNYGTRIDYILLSADLLPWVQSVHIRPDVQGSDHCPVVLD
ncbi:Endonuclease/exonuclease/phosphatase, partial [Piptocephalis cylindrospora]